MDEILRTLWRNGIGRHSRNWTHLAISRYLIVGGMLVAPFVAQGAPSGYSYGRSITISHTQVPNTDQNNFPVMVSISDPTFKSVANGGHIQNANAFDVVFTSDASGNTQIPYERDTYNPSTGQLICWVKLATVSHSADTVFYVWYGNASVSTDQSTPTTVWDSNFGGVWHLRDNSTSGFADSTTHGNNGTLHGSLYNASGQIGGALNSTGDFGSGYLDVGSDASVRPTSAGTFEAWASSPMPYYYYGLVSDRSHSGWPGVGLEFTYDHQWLFGVGTSGNYNYTQIVVTATANGWQHLVGTWDGTTVKVYRNGTLAGSNSQAYSVSNSGYSTKIFVDGAVSSYYNFDGMIDEVRISNSARSADWVATEYNNMNSPGSFYSLGAETQSGPTISSASPSSGPVGTSVTISGSNFGASQSTSTVTFNGVGAGTASTWTATSVTVLVPSGASTGDVVVTVGGVASNSVTFTVTTGGGGGGTVTSVTAGTGLTGGTITTSGTIGLNLGSANSWTGAQTFGASTSVPGGAWTSSGSVGIGTASPGYRLDVQGGQVNSSAGYCINGANCISSWPSGGTSQWTTSSGNIYYNGGNVGIGTTSPLHLLHVAGTIGAVEVIVSTSGADYVFQPGYHLRPLREVANYIQANHHLPDLPSADEVKEKGMGVGEMEAKLLAKIEELTLHMIELKQENEALAQEVRKLYSDNESIRKSMGPAR
jgi:hypothetical protein